MIQSAATLTHDRELTADLCVVGTGAGGAMVAREAARAGLRVVALEEGGNHRIAQFDQREDVMLPLLFQDAGARTTADGAVMVLQGRGIGGSTVHNTNLCKRAPAAILDGWQVPGFSARELDAHYRVVERDLHVSQIEESRINRNNALLRAGVEKLGWRGAVLHHNRVGCLGAGFCELGCPFDAKENAMKVLIPEAVAAGAEVWADCRAERVLMDRGGRRAIGVRARALDAAGRPGPVVTVRASVCLAGSSVGSAALALKSGLGQRNAGIGRSLHLHPGVAVAGLFDDPIEGWSGIPQSYECTEKLRFDEGAGDDRIWITTAFAHPIGMAASLPGFGAAHMRMMRLYPRLAVFIAMVHDRSTGRVELGHGGRLRIEYALGSDDQRALKVGMSACAELLFAAGARKVLVPFARPLELGDRAQIARIGAHVYRPLDPILTAVHPMGTLPLGRVTDERGHLHGHERLWVADGSLFPSSIGGPPQLSIYAFAHKIAGHIVEELRG